MNFLLLVFGGLMAWLMLFHHLDRPSVPAWKVRNAYRLTSVFLLLLLIAVSYKMTQFYYELKELVHQCQ